VNNPNGYDMIFTSDAAGQNKLPFQVESYNAATGQLIAWVQAPSLSNSADTSIYLFYGNANISSSQANPAGVWDSNYAGVWHMNDNAANTTVADSTANANTGIAQANTGAKSTAGQFASGLTFNGSSDQVVTTNSLNNPQSETVQIWFNTTSPSGHKLMGFENGNSPVNRSSSYDRQLWIGTDGKVYGGVYSNDYSAGLVSTATYNNGTWHSAAFVFDSTAQKDILYVDGAMVASKTDTTFPQSYTGWYRIGAFALANWSHAADGYYSGKLQEARVSLVARSAAWIATEYNNQSNPGGFYTLGSESGTGGG